MSLATSVGTERNLLEETPEHAHQLAARPADPAQPRARDAAPRRLTTSSRRARSTSPGRSPRAPAGDASAALERICRQARRGARRRVNILILSDRQLGPRRAPIPSLLAVAAVHHHLVREGTRLRAGIIVESGEPREVHHFATLIGYGASADQPVPDARDARRARRRGRIAARWRRRCRRALSARTRPRTSSRRSAKGCSRRSPRWASRRSSPTAARRSSRPSGSDAELIDKHFTGTASRIGGVGVDVLAAEALERHARAYPRPERRAAARRRRVRVAARRRAPHVEPGDDRARAARGARGQRRRRRRPDGRREAHAAVRESPRSRSTASTRGWSTRTLRAGRRCGAC